MTMDQGKRARFVTALVLLSVLGAGVIIGVALDRRLEATESGRERLRDVNGGRSSSERRWGNDARGRDSSQVTEARDSARRRPSLFFDQVGLTEEQMNKVDSIVGYFRAQMRALHEELDEVYNTRVRELNQAARTEVRAVLSADQLIVYDSIRADWERRRQERRQDSTSVPDSASGER